MKKVVFFLLLCFVLVLAGCGSESTIQKVESSAPPETQQPAATTAAEEKAEEKQKEPEIFALGDTVQFDDLLITLNGVRTSKGDEFLTPDNDFFLVLDLTVENAGSEPVIVSSMLQMSLYDADAYKYNQTFITDLKGSVDGEVAPGRKLRGELAFDVPASEHYEFVFENPLTVGQAIWRFQVK